MSIASRSRSCSPWPATCSTGAWPDAWVPRAGSAPPILARRTSRFGSANTCPELWSKFVHLCIDDHDFVAAKKLWYRILPFIEIVTVGVGGERSAPVDQLARGYEPVTTCSLHWITDPGFRRAVAQYLEGERDAVDYENAALAERTPFRKG